jgi:hypothetical protein
MRYIKLTALIVLGIAAVAAFAKSDPVITPPLEPVYIEGGQYSARLDQATRTWRLMPMDGQDMVVSNPDIYCRSDAPAPRGIWVIVHGEHGQLELHAPSDTVLPPGHSGRIALRDCAEPVLADQATLRIPSGLVEWLSVHSGAVFIDE